MSKASRLAVWATPGGRSSGRSKERPHFASLIDGGDRCTFACCSKESLHPIPLIAGGHEHTICVDNEALCVHLDMAVVTALAASDILGLRSDPCGRRSKGSVLLGKLGVDGDASRVEGLRADRDFPACMHVARCGVSGGAWQATSPSSEEAGSGSGIPSPSASSAPASAPDSMEGGVCMPAELDGEKIELAPSLAIRLRAGELLSLHSTMQGLGVSCASPAAPAGVGQKGSYGVVGCPHAMDGLSPPSLSASSARLIESALIHFAASASLSVAKRKSLPRRLTAKACGLPADMEPSAAHR
eukprot:scaffold307365_cov27-Tisochrysis_lutea.AAC.1